MAKKPDQAPSPTPDRKKRVLPARRTDHPPSPLYETNYGRRILPIPTTDYLEDDNPFVENARRTREG